MLKILFLLGLTGVALSGAIFAYQHIRANWRSLIVDWQEAWAEYIKLPLAAKVLFPSLFVLVLTILIGLASIQ